MTLREAVAQGILRVRKASWKDPDAYIRMRVEDGFRLPWGALFTPMNATVGQPNPQMVLLVDRGPHDLISSAGDWLPWEGPLNEADTE